MIGGEGRNQVELFSTGQPLCSKTFLAQIPTGQVRNPVLALLSKKIVACVSDTCWSYNIEENSWTIYTKMPSHPASNSYSVGQIYNEKLFIVQGTSLMVFNPSNGAWKSLPGLPNDPGEGSCAVTWNQNLFIFGGRFNPRSVSKFNYVSEEWLILDTSSPMDIFYSGCQLIEEIGSVLIVGSEASPYRKSSLVFNLATHAWAWSNPTKLDRFGCSLILLNDRIFSVGGGSPEISDVVEEFDLENGSWSGSDLKLGLSRRFHSQLTIPASLFSHICY